MDNSADPPPDDASRSMPAGTEPALAELAHLLQELARTLLQTAPPTVPHVWVNTA